MHERYYQSYYYLYYKRYLQNFTSIFDSIFDSNFDSILKSKLHALASRYMSRQAACWLFLFVGRPKNQFPLRLLAITLAISLFSCMPLSAVICFKINLG